jgi:perosamine synthetase
MHSALGAPTRIRLASPDVDDREIAAVARVLRSGILTNGPETAAFETAFAARHRVECGIAFANGTVALAALYLALGIGPGDEVIVPSMTFISSATSVLHVGARPVFADIEPETFTLDPADVARKLTPRTKAILAVHYAGQPADMDGLRAVADDARILLLEDAAEAHGATYRGRPVGGLGAAAMFSFTPTKNITMGEGGLVTTDDGGLAARLRLLRNHGQIALYEHAQLGYNWRLTEMQAAMGLVQLEKLDAILARKASNAMVLRPLLEVIPGVRPPVVAAERTHTFMIYTILLSSAIRDAVLQGMLQAGIEARVYFPPAHRQPVFARTSTDLPATEEVAGRMLSVPFHSRLSASELIEIANTLATLLGVTMK